MVRLKYLRIVVNNFQLSFPKLLINLFNILTVYAIVESVKFVIYIKLSLIHIYSNCDIDFLLSVDSIDVHMPLFLNYSFNIGDNQLGILEILISNMTSAKPILFISKCFVNIFLGCHDNFRVITHN